MGHINTKKIVGVTQRIDEIEGRGEFRDSLDHKLYQWVYEAGFLPVGIPNILPASRHEQALKDWLQKIQPDALLLSGGNDIDVYSERDATESYLLSWAGEQQIPVLGICRGLQMMAVWAGSSLVRQDGHVRTRHELSVTNDNGEWPANVNSYHNYGLSSCPADFEVVAQAEDGSIEAIKHLYLPWEGWMWHPERESPYNEVDTQRFLKLIDASLESC